MAVATETVRTKIPARMDRLPWSRWHWLVVFALGTVWILDGLEVTIKGAVGPSLREALGFTTVQVAGVASIYLFGAVSGALFWGYLTDRFGRKKLFIWTLATYMVGVLGTSLTGLWILGEGFEYVWFAIFRFTTGFGIGGEYAAINSAIDELIPARVRGWVDLAINGSWWIGTAVGAALGALYLTVFPVDVAFRVAFAMGLILAIGILLLRFFVPESPRWLMTHGYEEEAEATVRDIEADVREKSDVDSLPEVSDEEAIELKERRSVGFVEVGRTFFKIYPNRSIVGFSLLTTQAFLYNAIFFTFGLMLTTFFGVANANVGWFLIPFAVGNYLGPLILGRFFDTVGRKVMIPATFWTAGALIIVVGYLFAESLLFTTAWAMTLAWVVIFFFASAGASSAYLTISETFPLELRAMAISFFYALATGIGGIIGPILYGALIAGGNPWNIFWGYVVGGVLMITGGTIHRWLGVEAAQMELEDVAAPLSAEEAEREEEGPVELSGPAGIDPADPNSIRRFQQEHGLEPDGVIGPRTMGALRVAGETAEGPDELRWIDVTDRESITRFQSEHGLTPDGIVGAHTRGAIRFAESRVALDPADEDSIRRFQRDHRLAEDGLIGPKTQAALRAVRGQRGDATQGFVDVDPIDPDSVKRFQRAVGLEADGLIGPETQGAIHAQRTIARRNCEIDPADPESVRAFQRDHDLEGDGVVGPRTREALRRFREELAAPPPARQGFGIDPADPSSIEHFQRAMGIDADGCIGPETRHALRQAPHLLIELDPTDPDSVKRFQEQHGIEPDGVIGPVTQGALRVEMGRRASELEEEDVSDDEREEIEEKVQEELAGLLAFDPSDPDAIKEFQQQHGLEPDGVIGPETQAALRGALAEEERELARPRHETAGRRAARGFRRRVAASGLQTASYLPAEDRDFDRELGEILSVLRKEGPMGRDELREAVHAKQWGPGRFRYVLKSAEEEGVVRRSGRDRIAAAG